MLSKADIFTFSYLGSNTELRLRRLSAHLVQLNHIRRVFTDAVIVSLEMGYTEEESQFIRVPGVCHIRMANRLTMPQARNLMLRSLYKSSTPRYCLILDDDSYPWDKEGIFPKSSDVVKAYLSWKPRDHKFAPAVISCMDVYRNYFFEKTLRVLDQTNRVMFDYEGVMLKGSVILIHSSCGVLFPEDKTFMEESYWRMDCLAAGKDVWRCSHLLLTELLRKDEDSTVSDLNKGRTHGELSRDGKRQVAKAYPRMLTLEAGIGDGDRILFRLSKPPNVFTDASLVPVVNEGEQETLI